MEDKAEGWLALFCIADIPLKNINDILIKACDGASYEGLKKPWYFWLATENFEEVQRPRKRPDGSDIMATEAPVDEFTSPYLGKDLETLATLLRNASANAWLSRVLFAVIDERTGEDGSLLLCYAEEDGKVDTVRAWPRHSSLILYGMEATAESKWRELKESWEHHKKHDGYDVI